jgi:membrane carboxypeptidase/penicillin-binding protein PbpC
VIWDVPSEFPPSGDPNDTRAPYVPNNYDGRFHGPVTVRTALSNSYNIPAVKTLQFVGIYDNPKTGSTGFITFAQKMGITTLTRPDYGLSLTLGGGDVSLLELTSAYSVFANGGVRVPPVSITKIEDYTGQVVYEYKPPAGEQVVRPEHAFLISSILSDNNARSPMFGAHSVLALPFQAAAKTGTTNDYRDNWTLGYTPDLTVGVWVGNADYTPMVDTTGVTGAAPIWSEFMQAAIPMIPGAPTGFTRPSGIVDRLVCSVSGTEPSQWCSNQRTEMFAYDQLPPSKDNDFWKMVKIDTWTGLAASPACSDYTADKMTINISDPWARKWFKDTKEGQDWLQQNGFDPTSLVFPPDRACTSSDPRPTLVFANLSDGQTISASPIDIFLVVNAPNFNDYVLSYGVGEHPSSWKTLVPKNTTPHAQAEKVYNWDLSGIPAGKIMLRLTMHSKDDHSAQKQITLNINIPTPTPTITPTATVTPIPTMTLTPTETNTPTVTVTPTP